MGKFFASRGNQRGIIAFKRRAVNRNKGQKSLLLVIMQA
tara:strand:- start:141 stop:257 length:117 start_codon:yes stop_codon:yes gene_type:complete